MKKPVSIRPSEPNINVYWILTDFCNFKCNYCPEHLHSGKFATGKVPGFPPYEDVVVFMDKLKTTISNGTHLNLQFGGGEPTLHPNFLDIIKYMSADNVHVGVTSNGSRSEEWWAESLPYLDNVTISLQHEFTKIEKINQIARLIIDSDTHLMFNLSCDPASWDSVMKLYNDLDTDLKSYVTPKVLNYLDTTKENYTYTDEQRKWIKSHTSAPKASKKFINSIIEFDDGSKEDMLLSRVTINNWNQFKGWKCSTASQSLMIDYSGHVSAGICGAKALGNLKDAKIDEDFLYCPFDYCPCPSDLRAEKYKV